MICNTIILSSFYERRFTSRAEPEEVEMVEIEKQTPEEAAAGQRLAKLFAQAHETSDFRFTTEAPRAFYGRDIMNAPSIFPTDAGAQ